jgi:pimeloyl-ACP methyl ester carboxylesterase/DNA-binding SARP family transcriptional activator
MGSDATSERTAPETRFATTPTGSSLAYQVIGDREVTVVSVPPMAQNIEMAWEWPAIRQMFEGFAAFCRFVAFDKRGTGMSSRSADIPRLDERVDELTAVFDHAGIDRAFVMGTSEGGPMALMFAATYPDRVQGVILESSCARLLAESNRDQDPAVGGRDWAMWARFVDAWGTPDSVTVDLFAPSLAGDARFRRWHQRYERNSASRDAIGRLVDLAIDMDARGVVHRIDCPVLMLHRVGDRVVPIDAARETLRLLRSHGVEVELVEMPGEDHFLYATDLALALREIERFTTGTVSNRPPRWRRVQPQIHTMGRFDVVVDGESVATSAWGSKQARTLLKRLVVARGQSVTRDELMELLWPQSTELGRLAARLSVQLSAVRQVLGGGVIADRSSIRLDLERVDVDIERWFALDDDSAIVAGYGGDFLPDDRYDDWATPLRDEIRARFGCATRRLAERSDADAAIDLWRKALTVDPYDEHSHRSLVATLRAVGRVGDARTAYRTYVSAMDDLGVACTDWSGIAP